MNNDWKQECEEIEALEFAGKILAVGIIISFIIYLII